MWKDLGEAIGAAALRQIREYETYSRAVRDENARRSRRSMAAPPLLQIRRPDRWAADPAFNPYLVRKRSSSIAHAITNKLKNGNYAPQLPAGFRVPKGSGGSRQISTFAIADEVISKRLYKSLMIKNAPRLSSHAFAYRRDRTPHDAISYIHNDIKREQRLFVAEYDFSSFFDKISHNYLRQTIEDLGIISTPLEMSLIETFLAVPEPGRDEGEGPPPPRSEGLPQGTSISLFLANLAASPIDKALERLGVGFARYADDTLIWSNSYDQICEASAILQTAAEAIGSPINVEKSPGVRLLMPTEARTQEILGTKSVGYLGHELGLRSIKMKSTSVMRIKQRIQTLLYTNLLMEPLRHNQRFDRLTDNDRDYVTYIWQLRRYLYGSLSENDVRRFQRGGAPKMTFEGVMAFFPLVDHDEDLDALDMWIATQTWLTLRKRKRILGSKTTRTPRTWDMSREQLIRLKVISSSSGDELDLRIPSIRRIAGVIRVAVNTHGFGAAADGSRLYLYDSE